MAKNKKSVTPHYELLYIISNKFTEEEIKPIIEKVSKVITDNKGEITYTEDWGKKIPVIVLTNVDDMSSVSDALEAGAIDYIVKTTKRLDEIVALIHKRIK